MKKDRSTKETCDFIVYSVLAFGIIICSIFIRSFCLMQINFVSPASKPIILSP